MEEHYLIDGFNFIYGKSRAPLRDKPAISSVVYQLETFVAENGGSVKFILDGSRFQGTFPSSRLLEVVCSKPDEKADTLIERFMHSVEPAKRMEWVLVSDDRAIQDMALGAGLRVMKPLKLWEKIEAFRSSKSKKVIPIKEPFNNPFLKL